MALLVAGESRKESSKAGDPIAKPMALAFPEGGYETTMDEIRLPVPIALPAGNDGRSFFDVQPVRDLLPAPDFAASAVAEPAVDPEIERQIATGLPVIRNVLVDCLVADLQVTKGEWLADLVRAMLDPQRHLGLILDDANHHLRTGPFLALPFGCETFGLGGSIATFPT